jgi:hypothetical protein
MPCNASPHLSGISNSYMIGWYSSLGYVEGMWDLGVIAYVTNMQMPEESKEHELRGGFADSLIMPFCCRDETSPESRGLNLKFPGTLYSFLQ